jgi:signal transduction histidine kinase
VIEVEDDGSGIPPDRLDEVFEPFVSFGKKEGTGLGLAIARSVVEQHGGSIGVVSSPDGSRFTITLPPRGPVSL